MSKRSRSFRLSPEALNHLGAVQAVTGSSQVAIIEQALALYRQLYDRDRDLLARLLQAGEER